VTQVRTKQIEFHFILLSVSVLAPEITLPPVSVSNKTGSNVFLTCEVAGVPLPVVEWVYKSQAGKQVVYPSTNKNIIEF
jgi:hypothetical protein